MTNIGAIVAMDEAMGHTAASVVVRGSALGAHGASLQSRWVLDPTGGRLVLRYSPHIADDAAATPFDRVV